MKNFSVFVNATGENSGNRNHTFLADNHRHGRTYGPLLHFLLATFLTKVAAKYVASSLLPLSHRPWLSNKPVNYLSFNQYQQSDPIWKPASPYLHGLTAFAADSYHDHYSPPDPTKIEEYHSNAGTELLETSTEFNIESGYGHEDTNIESPDQLPSQSQYSYRRQPPQRWSFAPKRNSAPRRNNRFSYESRVRNPPNRFGTTTPYYDYYDNYDDFINRRPPYRTRRPPNRRRPSTENYDYLYDSSEYDDYSYDEYLDRTTRFYDRTTKPYRKRRKPTKRTKTKNRARESEEELESDESVEEFDEATKKKGITEEDIEPQQRQQATTTAASTTTESTESTTEVSTTTTQVTTTSTSSPNVTQSTGYGPGGNYDHISFTYGPPVFNPNYGLPFNGHHNGYGPSNGNERISITQAPATFPIFYHNFPYTKLFPQEFTKNAIVQKVHDIVGYEHDFVQRK